MNYCSPLIEDLISVLKTDVQLAQMNYIVEYAGIKSEVPLKNPVIVIGIDNVMISRVKDTPRISVNSSPSTTCVRVALYVSKFRNGLDMYGLFDRILKACSGLLTKFNVLSMESEKLEYNLSTDCLVLPLKITIDNGNAY